MEWSPLCVQESLNHLSWLGSVSISGLLSYPTCQLVIGFCFFQELVIQYFLGKYEKFAWFIWTQIYLSEEEKNRTKGCIAYDMVLFIHRLYTLELRFYGKKTINFCQILPVSNRWKGCNLIDFAVLGALFLYFKEYKVLEKNNIT